MNANYQATEKLALNFGAVYNYAEAGMSSINHQEPFDAVGLLNSFYNGDGPSAAGAAVLTNDEDQGWEERLPLVANYSDLEYSQLDLTVSGTYNFSDRLYTTASLTYSDFDSNEEYVFGDEGGESYYGFVGVGYRF